MKFTPRRLLSGLAALATLATLAGATSELRAERPRVYAITDATVVVSPGRQIDRATVVVRDGLIETVSTLRGPPADAEVISGEGLWVYSGLIDLRSMLELNPAEERNENAPRPRAQPTDSGAVHPLPRVRAELRARDRLLPFEESRLREMQRLRNLGFTTVLAAPERGLFRGRSAAIHLADQRPVAEMILRDDVAQHAAFEHGKFGEGYPSSLMGAVAGIRQTLLDAERHTTWTARYADHPQGMPRPEFYSAFEALAPVVAGEQPLLIVVADPLDALIADRIGHEFDLDVVIAASGHEWEIAEQVARTERLLLLPLAGPDKPDVTDEDAALDVSLRQMRRYLESASAPARLHEAGVRFALTTRGLKGTARFAPRMREVIDAGLPGEIALAAWTTIPAQLLGLESSVGTVEPGKIADLVVSSGPPFDPDAKPTRIFVDGIPYDVETAKRPKGDPDAVVDPRGEWSVVFEIGARSVQRVWTITGDRDAWSGTAETQAGTADFESVELAGNALSVTYAPRAGRLLEITVIIEGDTFEGSAEMGSQTATLLGTRTSGPGTTP